MTEMTDEELLGYAEIHCRTDLGLFRKDHVNRLLALAGANWCREHGYPPQMPGPKEWYGLGPEVLGPVIGAARRRMKETM